MGAMNGANMLRVLGVLTMAALMSNAGHAPPAPALRVASAAPAAIDVAALLAAARGAPPLICGLAARSISNGNWGWWSDVPASPLGAATRALDGDRRSIEDLPDADVTRVLDAMASDDACVREMSVRLVGHQDESRVAAPLISKLSSPDASVRVVAALGLGLVDAQRAVDPLIGTLRDATAEVRANSAWALGRIENGRALAPLTGMFRDGSPLVREAAVAAVGRFESTSAVAALLRVLQEDQVASVRRVAAWALGHLESRESAQALASVLARDGDPRVREMTAWALGQIEQRAAGTPALQRALREDADDAVRETAAWALAQLEDRTAIDALVAALGDRSGRVRGTAAWALGQLDGGETRGRAPAALARLLKDDSEDVRRKAAWALGNVGDASAVPAIRDAMRAEQSSEVRRALVRALTRSGGRSEAVFTELLSSTDPKVREAAVRGLAGQNAFNPWPWPWPRPRPFP
jgi:HEAT repeat protein